jgi:hypothetical protein
MCIAGGKECLVVFSILPMLKLMSFVRPEVLKILNVDIFGPLKSFGGGSMVVRRTHLERPVGRSYGVHTGHNTGDKVRLLVANDETEFKILTFRA